MNKNPRILLLQPDQENSRMVYELVNQAIKSVFANAIIKTIRRLQYIYKSSLEEIENQISLADLIIGNMDGGNVSVTTSLDIAISKSKPVILIEPTERGTVTPERFLNLSYIKFSLNKPEQFISQLSQQAKAVFLPEIEKQTYDVALSYASEDRRYVEAVALELRRLGVRVFYDNFETANLWGNNLYSYFQDIYEKQAKYIVIFISESYGKKIWTNHERRIAQARAFTESRVHILPARFDDTEIDGFPKNLGYVNLENYTSSEFANLILKRIGKGTDTFATRIRINTSRNISNFTIHLSDHKRSHLIITGKNGSGKTSLINDLKASIQSFRDGIKNSSVKVFFSNPKQARMVEDFIVVYFGAKRDSKFNASSGINKTELSKVIDIDDGVNKKFLEYIVNLKADRSFANDDGELKIVEKIDNWFARFENSLQEIFNSQTLKLKFDRKNYDFHLIEDNKLPFGFNALSDGYSAILSIVTELIMRMEAYNLETYDLEGIALIDEIETHLHVDLQKKILPFLINLFPKIQFIVTTHSPFVLSSVSDAVICDLEKRIITKDLSGYSYDTLVESYFDSDNYSEILKNSLYKYESLLDKEALNDEEKDRLFELKRYLNEIPKFFSDELAVKLQQIKIKELDKKARK